MLSAVDFDEAFQAGELFENPDALILWILHVETAAKAFSDLAGGFREATRRYRRPKILRRDVRMVFPLRAGKLLCKCWDRGEFLILSYRSQGIPDWDLRRFAEVGKAAGGSMDTVYPKVWFAFIRWHLIPTYPESFRADCSELCLPALDFVFKRKQPEQWTPYSVFCNEKAWDTPEELDLIKLDGLADIQATACDIMAEHLSQVLERANAKIGGQRERGEGFLLKKATTTFGFKTAKELRCFLDRHPEVETWRPPTKTGKPNPRRCLVSVVQLARAVSRDDTIMSDPARKARMQSRLQQARLAKDLEDKAVAYIKGANK